MANWSNPLLTSTYTNFLAEVKARDEDLAKQFDGQTVSNLPTNAIRWDSAANRWKKWDGSSWVELTGTYALTALSTTGNASIGGTLSVTGTTALAAATATTPATGDNSTAVATTSYVRAQGYASLASPGLTGTPTAPTAAVTTNTTQLATTAFVNAEIANDAPTKTGGGASGTWAIAISGNAATATNLSTGQGNWSTNGTISAVVGLLSWKNSGNNHVIFDASAGTSPSGGAVNNTNAAIAWSATYPTLMGWNGTSTYGVRVDSARVADTLQTARTINGVSFNGSANITLTANNPNSLTFNNGGAGGASGSTFNGGSALTISYNTVGAPSTTGTNASGSWPISVTGSAASATSLTGTSTANINSSALATGTADSTTFLRGDRSWQATPAPAALTTASGAAPSYSARAWVQFNATGTVNIRAQGNVSGITDSGVGRFSVNFTTAMQDINYATFITSSYPDSSTNSLTESIVEGGVYSTTAVGIVTQQSGGGNYDSVTTCVSIFR